MSIVLKPVRSRSRGGRTSTKSPDKRVVRKPAHYRRNPDVFGTPIEDVAAAIGGGYLSLQVAGFLSGIAQPVVNFFDRFRAGLGSAALTGGSAVAVGWGIRRFWRHRVGNMAQFGGFVVAANQGLTALVPTANALEGQPQLSQGGAFQLLKGGKTDKKVVATPPAAAVNGYHPDYPSPAASDDVGI